MTFKLLASLAAFTLVFSASAIANDKTKAAKKKGTVTQQVSQKGAPSSTETQMYNEHVEELAKPKAKKKKN